MSGHPKTRPLFTRDDYIVQAKILTAAAALMDGRDSRTRFYRKLAAMLVFADVHIPKGLPRNDEARTLPTRP
jgi:hypothetical protein